MADEAVRYHFGVPAARGLLLGLGPARVAALALGLAGLTGALVAGTPAVLAVAPLLVAGAYCWAPLGGRPVHEWSGPVLRHMISRATGAHEFTAPLPEARLVHPPESPARRASRQPSPVRPVLPRELGGLAWREIEHQGSRLGLALEAGRGARLATAVFAVAGPDRFLLCDESERAAHIAAWGEVLASTASERGALRRLEWVERATPTGDDGDHARLEHGAPSPGGDYRILSEGVRGSAVRHEVLVAAQLAGPPRDDEATGRVAAAECKLLAGRLTGAGLVTRPLSLPELAGVLSGYSDLSAAGRPAASVGEAVVPAAGPQGHVARWDHLVTDELLHRAYAVVAWPRVPVASSWMEPLLLAASPGVVRTVAMHLEPVPTSLALRRASAARLGSALDADQRARWGFLPRAADAREAAEADRREEELVSGYAEHRIAAVIMVSAADHAALEEAGRSVEQAALAARLDLRLLYGRQDEGWAAALPLCRLRFRGAM